MTRFVAAAAFLAVTLSVQSAGAQRVDSTMRTRQDTVRHEITTLEHRAARLQSKLNALAVEQTSADAKAAYAKNREAQVQRQTDQQVQRELMLQMTLRSSSAPNAAAGISASQSRLAVVYPSALWSNLSADVQKRDADRRALEVNATRSDLTAVEAKLADLNAELKTLEPAPPQGR